MTRSTTFPSGPWRLLNLLAALVLSIFLLCPSAFAHEDAVVVVPATGHGISASYIEYARSLLVAFLGQTKHFYVVDFSRPAEAHPRPHAELAAVARYHRAAFALAVDLSRGDPKAPVFLTITRIDALEAPPRELREVIDTSPEYLPDVFAKLAPKLRQLLDIAEVAPSPRAKTASSPTSIGGSLNLLVPLGAPPDHIDVLGGFGLFLSFDRKSLIINLGVDFAQGNHARTNSTGYTLPTQTQYLHTVGVDLLAPWSTGSLTPYAGLGIAGAMQRLGGRGAWGIQARPIVGLLYGRQASVRARFEVRYFADLFTEQELDRLYPGSDRRHRAHGFLFSAGVSL